MAKKNKDLRSPLAKARDKWLASFEGEKCCEDMPRPYGQYLINRLKLAFIAGWYACEKLKIVNRHS